MPAAPTFDSENGGGEDGNLWSRILSEVQSKSAVALPQGTVIVLGDNESGKSSLIARLRKVTEPKKGAGLEYHYLEVNPDYRDGTYAYQLGSALPDVGPGESTRLGVWVVDGEPVHAPLLRFALQSSLATATDSSSSSSSSSSGGFDRCVLLLCASMLEPWKLMESLRTWASILHSHLLDHATSLSSAAANKAAGQQAPTAKKYYYNSDQLRDGRERQVRFWQEYVEPLDSSSHSEFGIKVPSQETEHILLPLGETTLTQNCGLPIIVAVTKCDAMTTLEKDYDFKDETWDFIQLHIRKFCLNYGAALIYTSSKETRNCDSLHKYLLHRVYGFPFTQPALVVEKDAVFIPAGWDNEKKIGILHENLHSIKADDDFEEHIKKPTLRRVLAGEAEVQAEDEQAFLQRQQAVMASQQASAVPAASPQTPKKQISQVETSRGAVSATPSKGTVSATLPIKKATPARMAAPTATVSASAAVAGGMAGQTSETALATFFNNLLKTKAGSSGSAAGRTGGAASDAEAELNRMLQKQPSTKRDGERDRNGNSGGEPVDSVPS